MIIRPSKWLVHKHMIKPRIQTFMESITHSRTYCWFAYHLNNGLRVLKKSLADLIIWHWESLSKVISSISFGSLTTSHNSKVPYKCKYRCSRAICSRYNCFWQNEYFVMYSLCILYNTECLEVLLFPSWHI